MFSRRKGARFNRGRVGGSGVIASPPVPLMLSPKSGDSIDTDVGNVYLHAVAPTGAPAVTSVEFFNGVTSLGTVSSEPYALLLTGVTAGSKSYTAVFTYASGPSPGTSAAVSFTVNAADTYDPSTIVDVWCDPTDNASITLTSGIVQTITNKGKGTAVVASMTQGTSTRRPRTARWRGRQAMLFGSNTGIEALLGTLSGSQAQPTQYKTAFRRLAGVSTGVMMSGGTTTRIRAEGAVSPFDMVLNAGASVTKSVADWCGHYITATANGASSAIAVDGSSTSGNASTGTCGSPISWGASSTPSSPQNGAYGDFIMNFSALSAGNNTDVDTWQRRRWDTDRTVLKLLSVGDSITLGNSSTDTKGFRSLWYAKAGEAPMRGAWVEAIGPLEGIGANTTDVLADDLHAGYSGEGIDHVTTTLLPLVGVSQNPHIIDIMIGTNNVREVGGETWVAGTGAGSTYEAWFDLCTDLLTAAGSSCHLIINTIPPLQDNTANTRAIELNGNIVNTGLAALLAAFPGRIWLADVNTAMGGPSYVAGNSADGVHPNDTGYTKIEAVKRTPRMRAIAVLNP